MNRLPLFTAAAMSAVACVFAAPAMAQDIPSDLRDMVYARAGQAEAELQRRGYVAVRTEAGSDRTWTNWWNADRRQCVSIVTRNGRYDSIVTAPAPDCRGGGRPISLGLICFGEGQKPAAANRWGWQWNWDSNRYDFGNRTELTTRQFDASVMIQLWDGGGRIRLPRSLIPPIHSGGTSRDGWWDLYDVYQDRGQIRATYRLNGPNKPRVTIDRRSGRIRIQGIYNYGFNGSCDTIDGRQHQRF